MRTKIPWFAVLVGMVAASPSHADTFGTGANSFEIELVMIGSPGNPPDGFLNPAGAVPYTYRIGKYEISEQMIEMANVLGGLGITKDERGPDKPATSVSWFDAARFVNWLNTSTGSVPAYKFDASGNFQLWQPVDPGYDPSNLYRNRLATYFLPSADEWYKAAYYDPIAGVYYTYPMGSNNIPDGLDFPGDPVFDAVFNQSDGFPILDPNDITNVGMDSPFGTQGQGGNVEEWEETDFDLINDQNFVRGLRGGSYGSPYELLASTFRSFNGPWLGESSVGFRIASTAIPEPTCLTLCALAAMMLGGRRMRTIDASQE